MAKETLTLDSLIAGEYKGPILIDLAAAQTVQRGDVLEMVVTEAFTTALDLGDITVTNGAITVTAAGEPLVYTAEQAASSAAQAESSAATTAARTLAASFARPSAVANIKNIYAVAAEDKTTAAGAAGKILAYVGGVFNEAAMRFGGSSTAAQNKPILFEKGIYLTSVKASQ